MLRHLEAYLRDEWQDKMPGQVEPLSSTPPFLPHSCSPSPIQPYPLKWKKVNLKSSVPQQRNTTDCGVFVCANAACLALGHPLTYTQQQMYNFRSRIGLKIVHMSLEEAVHSHQL